MTIALITTSSQHPLITYMKHWEAFNNVDRRATRRMLIKAFLSCILVIASAQFFL